MIGLGNGGQGEQRFTYDVNGHLIKLTDVQDAADNRRFVVDSMGNTGKRPQQQGKTIQNCM